MTFHETFHLLGTLRGMFAGKQLIGFMTICWIRRTAGFMFLVFVLKRSGN